MKLYSIRKTILFSALMVAMAAPALANNSPSLFNRLKGSLGGNETTKPYSFVKQSQGFDHPYMSEADMKALQEELDDKHRAQIAARQEQVLEQYLSLAYSGVSSQPARQGASPQASTPSSQGKRPFQIYNNKQKDQTPARLYNVPD